VTDFPKRVRAFAPASIGNLGPGLDVLGCALTGAGDTVTAEWCGDSGVVLRDAGHPELPTDPALHSSAIAAAAVLRQALGGGTRPPASGIALSVKKELPLSAGQGGSAASAVAGAVAANVLKVAVPVVATWAIGWLVLRGAGAAWDQVTGDAAD
jgi:homoserine kinase